MKELFHGFYNLSDSDFKSLWSDALFIFDTNVLLNLYRYQSSTSHTLLTVMEKLAEKVWIPYHVGLEFQRNRLVVIAEQHSRFLEVQRIVNDSITTMNNKFEALQLNKRHSHINPDKLISDFKKIQNEFKNELDELEKKSISVNSDDEIRNRIDALFVGKIGYPPTGQNIIDQIAAEGEKRYKNNIPPGFKDSSKGDKSSDEFTYNGITYNKKYGDLIIWKQIIEYALDKQHKNIVFVTDDAKADWWWKIDSNGTKTIGARPELKDEICREGRVENFHVYSTESFLYHASSKFNTEVTEDAINEIREITFEDKSDHKTIDSRTIGESVEISVREWLSAIYDHVEFSQRDQLDLVAYNGDRKYGFEVKVLISSRMALNLIKRELKRLSFLLSTEEFNEICIILVFIQDVSFSNIRNLIVDYLANNPTDIKIILGKVNFINDDGSIHGFTAYTDI